LLRLGRGRGTRGSLCQKKKGRLGGSLGAIQPAVEEERTLFTGAKEGGGEGTTGQRGRK